MATNRRDITDRERLRELEGGGGGGRGGFGPRTTLVPRLNREEIEGYTYRSPRQTNANSVFPHPLEDTIASQRADFGRIGRGLNAEGRTERGRLMQQEAGGRALTRTGSRAGVAALAVGAGNELRKEKEKEKAEKKKLAAAKADARESKERADKEVDTSSADPDFVRGEQYGRGAPDGMKRGGQVKKMASGGMTSKASGASKRADGVAQRGKTKGRMC